MTINGAKCGHCIWLNRKKCWKLVSDDGSPMLVYVCENPNIRYAHDDYYKSEESKACKKIEVRGDK